MATDSADRNERGSAEDRHPLRDAVFNSPELFIGLMDTDGTLIEANRTALEFAGVEHADVAGEYFPSTVWWQDDTTARSQLETAIRAAVDGESSRFSANHVTEGGQRVIADVNVRPVRDDTTGEVVNVIAEGKDVTEQRERERELRALNEEMNALLENVPVTVFKLDPDGVFQRCSGSAMGRLGIESSELVGEQVLEAFDGIEGMDENIERALDSEEVRTIDQVHGLYYETWFRPVFDGDSLREVIGISRDVTELKRREVRLEHLSRAISDLFTAESSDEAASSVVEITREIVEQPITVYRTFENDSLRPMATTEETIEFVGAEGIEDFPVLEQGSSGMATFESNSQPAARDFEGLAGTEMPDVPLDTIVSVPIDDHGLLTVGFERSKEYAETERHLLSILADATGAALEKIEQEQELADYRSELEQSNQDLQQFAYLASHDLQEPLRMVSSYVDLLDTEYGDQLDDEASEYIEFAVDGANRMQNMIDALLRYSRVETQASEFERVDPEAIVERTRNALALKIDETDATISVEPLPTVRGDPDQLSQVFQNLLENAIAYTEDGIDPQIEVSGTLDGEMVDIAVTDNGVGIDPEDAESIFEIFEREDTDTEGTGVGLAVCRRIVDRHDGEIWAEPATDGGTTFRFTLPAEETDE